MRMVIVAGMLIVFISVFFVLFTFDVLIKEGTTCLMNFGLHECNSKGVGTSMTVGIAIISMFILVDIIALYLLFTSLFRSR